jgi:Zn-dependent peptidase ImmA (M78 family)
MLKLTGNLRPSSSGLSPDRQTELSDLAAAVAEAHCPDCRIDPEKIIKAKEIPLFYDNYADSFDGMIECVNGRFYIHCNLDRDNIPGTPRARFTLSHELGHYFIDEHRNNLAAGKVPPHPSFSDKCVGDLTVEREADFFASHLLMPDKRFKSAAKNCPPGLPGIESIADQFEVSVTCAAIRFVTTEVFPAVVIKWSSEGYAWKWCSRQFWTMGYRKTIQSAESLPEDSATKRCLALRGKITGVVETATTAAWWFFGVPESGPKSVVIREEAMALGRFGVITLLTLHSGKFPDEVVANRNAELGY